MHDACACILQAAQEHGKHMDEWDGGMGVAVQDDLHGQVDESSMAWTLTATTLDGHSGSWRMEGVCIAVVH